MWLNRILFFITASLAGYYFYITYITPCSRPITYRIGTFDSRFDISREKFLAAMNEATSLWGNSIDKKLFEYKPEGELVVNLIYDNRQRTTEKRAFLQADSEKIKNLATSVKAEYDTLQANYKSYQEAYEKLLNDYQNKQQAYNDKVNYWNKQGGAPNQEYELLVAEKESLATDYNLVETKRQEVNSLVNQINVFSDKYNLLVRTINKNIDTINETAGTEFQEGIYNPSNNSITIYEFESNEKLIRVLAHEFGHALTLDHNDNPESIMYKVNSGDQLVPSTEDIAALKAYCRL